jgi:hypothetical protein
MENCGFSNNTLTWHRFQTLHAMPKLHYPLIEEARTWSGEIRSAGIATLMTGISTPAQGHQGFLQVRHAIHLWIQ